MIGIHDDHAAAAWQVQSLLLSYPDETLPERLALLREVAGRLPGRVGRPLARFLDHVGRTPAGELAADYVETFDQRRRCSLFLTYYTHGDTRGRGAALLQIKQAYEAAGLGLVEDELPDHLAVVLEFAATTDAERGRRLLIENRAGLELLRLALRDLGSPWADVLDSVSATLPSLGRDESAAVARLAAAGPPGEQVGLAPYAAVDLQDRMGPSAGAGGAPGAVAGAAAGAAGAARGQGPVALPDPVFRGASPRSMRGSR